MSETVELTSTNSHVLAPSSSGQDLVSLLSRKVVGQSTATNIIVPYVYMYQSGLAPTGRPAGVFLLLGPTGTGKTRTVEAIAESGREIRLSSKPSILIVDDNHDLLLFLAVELKEAGWEMLTAESAPQARELFAALKPNVVLVDYKLGNDDGLQLGLEFQRQQLTAQIIMMTGGGLNEEGLLICETADVPVLYKPFLASEVLNLIRGRVFQTRAAVN